MQNRKDIPHLALYHFQSCPFCAWTRQELSPLGLDIELRDIRKNDAFRKELIRGGGKQQVPCLRIEQDGQVRWLYESSDIVRYAKKLSEQLVESA